MLRESSRNSRLILLSLLAVTLPAWSAQGGQRKLCADPALILEQLDHCGQNGRYLELARACVRKLDQASGRSGGAFGAATALRQAQTSQAGKLSASNKDYSRASAELASLIAMSQRMIKEVDAYLDHVILPEDFDNPEFTGGDELAYVALFPCYAETTRGLEDILQDLREKLASFEAAKLQTDSHALGTAQRRQAIQSDSSKVAAPVRRGPAPASAPAAPKRKSARDSGISGVEEHQQRKKQAP
jgi:hypothetical protein